MQVYREMFSDATPERTERMFHYLDADNTGYVDYLGWSQTIKLQVRLFVFLPLQLSCLLCMLLCLTSVSTTPLSSGGSDGSYPVVAEHCTAYIL